MDPVTQKIREYVALLTEDGATLQMGIGKIPDAVLTVCTIIVTWASIPKCSVME